MTRILSLAAAGALATTSAGAQLAQTCEEPIDIAGDLAEIVNSVATVTGNVRAVQCDGVLATQKLIAEQGSDGAYKLLRAEGAVRYSNGTEAITGDHAVYDVDAKIITFSDNVIVTQGKQVMAGGRLIYSLETGNIKFLPGEGSRVRGIFHTNSEQPRL